MISLKGVRDYLRDGIDLASKLVVPETGEVKIYHSRLKQGVEYPAITLRQTSGLANEQLANESRLAMAMVEVEAYGYKGAEVEELLELVRLRPLSHYRGYMGIVGFGRVWIDSCTIASDATTVDKPLTGTDRWKYKGNQTYRMIYARQQPYPGG